tara:strand:- start:1319 stop:2008 length:690 start_codon:yes stop_codon:yes gene_type:complete
MKINTALILCAGFGKRLNPLTLKKPKPLLQIKNQTILESCIYTVIKLKVENIFLNTFYLSEQINEFIKNKNFPVKINIIEDGRDILDTGGGVLNMINHSDSSDFFVFNPDTIWNENYVSEINDMQKYYFQNELNNILLLVNKKLSFDNNLEGDFDLKDNMIKKNVEKNFIYTGCQILNKSLFNEYKVENFSVAKIWNKLLLKQQLNGFESTNKFYHLTNLEIFKKLKGS